MPKMLFALLLVLATPAQVRADDASAWSALRDGEVVALIRHARAPGTGDPPGFQLGDCSTQRNLDERGRAQAIALGARFRAERVAVTHVRSSRWCRAYDTATLAFPSVIVEPDSDLDSLLRNRGREDAQTAAVRAKIASWRGRQTTLVLVTHQVNITALTGIVPAEGEVVVLRPTAGPRMEIVGRVLP